MRSISYVMNIHIHLWQDGPFVRKSTESDFRSCRICPILGLQAIVNIKCE
jgi:hypothetical protein